MDELTNRIDLLALGTVEGRGGREEEEMPEEMDEEMEQEVEQVEEQLVVS